MHVNAEDIRCYGLNAYRKQELPQVYVADMREELKHGNRSILSDRLIELMQDRLDKKEQMMLFLNRRDMQGLFLAEPVDM